LKAWKTKGGLQVVDQIIRNTYKTLMTRGQKGCYIYCEDEALAAYIKSMIQQPEVIEAEQEDENQIILQDVPEEDKYITFYPVYSIRAACGRFGDLEPVEQLGWMQVQGYSHKNRKRFVVQAVGQSMEPRIHDGDYCLFEAYSGGSREGKIVLTDNIGDVDDDYSGSFTIKEYHSKKTYNEDGEWEHESITLKSLNRLYPNIEIDPEEASDFKVIAEFLELID